jgi:hypothetical protein
MLKKISHNNPFYKILVVDPANIDFFSYECDIDLPRVIVSEKPEVMVQNFGDHVNVVPFEWEDEKQFNKLALETIIKSAELSKQVASNFREAKDILEKQELSAYRVLISRTGYTKYGPKIYNEMETIGPVNYSYWVDSFDDIADNEAYVIAEPEFVGVISCRPVGDKELYGIGICNINGIVKVVIE